MIIPALIGGAAAIGGALIGGRTQQSGIEEMNAANAAEAARNRDFQERMSNTAYQRATNDMRAAGLNPALAYQQGGASQPSGNQAVMQNAKIGYANAAHEAVSQAVAIAQSKANVAKTNAETRQLTMESEARLQEIQARAADLRSNTHIRNNTQTSYTEPLGRLARAQFDKQLLDTDFGRQSLAERLEAIRLENNLSRTQAAYTSTQTRLASQGLTHDWFNRNISPWINDAGAFTKIIPRIGINTRSTTDNRVFNRVERGNP